MLRPEGLTPDFRNIQLILEKRAPYRPTAYEFFWSDALSARVAGVPAYPEYHTREDIRVKVEAFYRLGYDYANIHGSEFCFPAGDEQQKATRGDARGIISDWGSFARCPFTDPDAADYGRLTWGGEYLRPGMKFIVHGPLGVLENVVRMVGYESLCLMIYDEPRLVDHIFAEVGSRLLRYFEICLSYDSVGAILVNDDWGFNTQTMLAPADMRKYVFPWHKRIVQAAHAAGKYAILHTCGNVQAILEDIIDDMRYDGRHSYEDAILPVERAYREYAGRLAVMGGIDMNFMSLSAPQMVFERSKNLLRETGCRGFALGSGNSIPEYVPDDNFFAMLKALWQDVLDAR